MKNILFNLVSSLLICKRMAASLLELKHIKVVFPINSECENTPIVTKDSEESFKFDLFCFNVSQDKNQKLEKTILDRSSRPNLVTDQEWAGKGETCYPNLLYHFEFITVNYNPLHAIVYPDMKGTILFEYGRVMPPTVDSVSCSETCEVSSGNYVKPCTNIFRKKSY